MSFNSEISDCKEKNHHRKDRAGSPGRALFVILLVLMFVLSFYPMIDIMHDVVNREYQKRFEVNR